MRRSILTIALCVAGCGGNPATSQLSPGQAVMLHRGGADTVTVFADIDKYQKALSLAVETGQTVTDAADYEAAFTNAANGLPRRVEGGEEARRRRGFAEFEVGTAATVVDDYVGGDSPDRFVRVRVPTNPPYIGKVCRSWLRPSKAE